MMISNLTFTSRVKISLFEEFFQARKYVAHRRFALKYCLQSHLWYQIARLSIQNCKWSFPKALYRSAGSLASRLTSRRVFSAKGTTLSVKKKWTAEDVASGLLDVFGWKVYLKENGKLLGIVDEIIQIGTLDSDEVYEYVLKLIQASDTLDGNVNYDKDTQEVDRIEFLIPLVEEIVGDVDAKARCLLITPPQGLLELARLPHAVKALQPQLLEFCYQQNRGLNKCLKQTMSKKTQFPHGLSQHKTHTQENVGVFMPTRKQLLAAGRQDLVEKIVALGGFLSVAHALGLRSRRRPIGFWDDLRNLDAEIEWFVSGSWIKQIDPCTEEEYYFNQATDEISFKEPSFGVASSLDVVEQDSMNVAVSVMPRQQKVKEAGRHDLHHAIISHGGYKELAKELGRKFLPRSTFQHLDKKLRQYMQEQSILHFPSFKELKAHKRYDLVYAIRKHGGINDVADRMELRPKRYGKGYWNSLEDAAAAVRSLICDELIEQRDMKVVMMDRRDLENLVWEEGLTAGSLRIPSRSTALRKGRADVHYLLQKYGHLQLADYLHISPQQ